MTLKCGAELFSDASVAQRPEQLHGERAETGNRLQDQTVTFMPRVPERGDEGARLARDRAPSRRLDVGPRDV